MEASLFSNLFGNNVLANTNFVVQDETEANSQNIGLLEANVSSATIIQDKKDKNSKDNKIDENKEVSILSNNALLPSTGPAGVSDGTDNGNISSDQISVYVVRKGDSVAQIADMFGVTSNTILWANDMKKGDKLVPEDVLIILPVTGVQVTVTKGQTLKSLATLYKVDVSDIAGFNGIASDAKLAVGDELIIPDGQISDSGTSSSSSNNNKKNSYTAHPLASYTGYFMNPVPGAKLTQGIHDRNAVDLAIAKGTPIYASAPGTVIFAKMGWNGAFGGLTIINDTNGTQTLYAHQSQIATHVGDQVSRGETIGYIGSTGHSTGPHLHFEIHGAKNPGADNSW